MRTTSMETTRLLFVVAAALAAALALGVQPGAAAAHPMPTGPSPNKKWMQIHGWLMWASMGFLMPLGIILIRYSRPQRNPTVIVSARRVRVLFHLHWFVQTLAALTATAGIVTLMKRTGTYWNYTHERLGLAILLIVLMQPFIGIVRPKRGETARSYWFLLHWIFGTGVLILGYLNIYIGMHTYEFLNATSIRSYNIAFSVQLAVTVLIYFLQDRWSYIVGQGSGGQNLNQRSKAGRHQTMAIDMSI